MNKTTQPNRRNKILLQPEFNPRIKTYILLFGVLICIVTIIGIVILPFWLIFGSMYIKRYFNNLYCELTTRALHFKKGVWFRTERTIPLDKIQDLTFKEGPLLRYLGLSILKVETAGQSVKGGADLSLIGIVDAQDFRMRVLDQRDMVTEISEGRSIEYEKDDDIMVSILKEMRDLLRTINEKLSDRR